jgi:hypothetical protein
MLVGVLGCGQVGDGDPDADGTEGDGGVSVGGTEGDGGASVGGAGGTSVSIESSGGDGSESSDAAGGASDGSAPLKPDEIDGLCEATCERIIGGVRLPVGLCEDFNVGASFEFCNAEGSDCVDQCVQSLLSASEPCARVLPAAINCVAATSAYSSGSLSFPCLFEGCEGRELVDMVAGCSNEAQLLAEARARWEAAGISSYAYVTADRTIVVSDGVAALQDGDLSPEARSVEDWFSQIETAIDAPGWAAVVVYDEALGFPTSMKLLTSPLHPDTCTGTIAESIEQFDVLE